MIRQSQSVRQSQILQQRLSPQQIQYIKLLQLPTLVLEQRIKQEIESNPVLELDEDNSTNDDVISEPGDVTEEENQDSDQEDMDETSSRVDSEKSDSVEDGEEITAVDQNKEIDWETFFHTDEEEYVPTYSRDQEDWRELPKPYKTSIIEQLESQVELLDLDKRQEKIADQIIGSVDPDGYLRRDLNSIIDAVAFNDGMLVTDAEAENVLRKIQSLDPPGIAARNLRECLLIQLELMYSGQTEGKMAMEILEKVWPEFEKKHYEKIRKKLNLTENQLRKAYHIIMLLDPKPGESDEYMNPEQFIVPDFEVFYEETGDGEDESGDFVIKLNKRNMPNIRISHHYKKMWDSMTKDDQTKNETKEAKQFIREKMESARWFIESIHQRQNTLMAVMKTVVALQEDFFRTGKGLRPMILKDVAERINMDISTVSRVVNGKYVQTAFGVYVLKYFFTEGLETDTGESVSNREIKNLLLDLVSGEDKSNPLSDQALADVLRKKGYPVARRTVSKYREQLNIPVARLRKDFGK